MALLPFAAKSGGSSFSVTSDTKANILAKSTTLGQIAYATDTNEFYMPDGTNWRKIPFTLVVEPANPDMGYTQSSNKIGYYTTAITDKTLYNTAILGNANATTGSIRTLNGQLQIYLNGKWNNVVINFVFREDSSFGYTFEHQPVGFTNYIEIMSGNSLNNLGINGKPIVEGYFTSMGAYPVDPTLDGGTF